MMRVPLFFLLFLGFTISCTDDNFDVPRPPSDWMVIGNDLGFRNEFVDMTNVVRLTDSNLTVFSVAYPDVALNFPIRDSVVIGSQDKQWQLTTAGPDSLLLHDTVQNNRYHLLRLKDYEPEENAWDLLTSSRFAIHSNFDDKTFAFEGNDTTGANCYVAHRIRTWRGERRPMRMKDGFWRLDQRFSQPILLYTLGQGDHYVTLIDSIDSHYGFQGQLVVNSRPNPQLNQRDTLRPIHDTMDMDVLRLRLPQMDFSGTTVETEIDLEKDNRWRISWNGSELEEALSVNDFEVNDLRLTFSDDKYSLTTLGGELASGNYELHPKYPYLMLDGSCTNELYLPIAYTSADEIKIELPIRIRLPDQEIRPVEVGRAQPGRVAYSENVVVFTIPFLAGSTK